jgi:hypothetical protein
LAARLRRIYNKDFICGQPQEGRRGRVVGAGGNYLKLQEGDNRIRLVSECLEHPGVYNGKPTFKWLCYVIDRKDGKIKPYFMPHTVYNRLRRCSSIQSYAFDEVPMPYDLTINAAGAGDIKVKYTVVPARNNTPLTPGEQALLKGTQPIRKLQAELREADGEGKRSGPID